MKQLLSAILLAMAMLSAAGHVAADGPYPPAADTYTDRNNTAANHGSDQNLLLSATNLAGCVETTYLWLKFDIPSTGATIAEASSSLTFGVGAGTTDLELRSSADTSWSEADLNWSNQPVLEPDVLATATGISPGSTATFTGAALATYLSARRGQTVSLVVLADCHGSVPPLVALALPGRENASGSAASLALTLACPDFVNPPPGVDAQDLQAIAAHWRTRPGPGWDPRFDLDGDDDVDIADIMLAAAAWGTGC